jgi:type III restriction enzyme
MRLRFDHQQPHQTDAVDVAATLLQGGRLLARDFAFSTPGETIVEPNEYLLDGADLLANLNEARAMSGLGPVEELAPGLASDSGGGFDNFSFEMETGTGKTYVMLRTIYRLHAEFGLRKFVLVVPSIAVKENSVKSATDLHDDLCALYPGTRLRTIVYSGSNPGRVRSFSRATEPTLLVVTLDAFNKSETNILLRESEALDPTPLIDSIARCRPVVLLDEPQNMGSTVSKKALGRLEPLVCLRYSATHRDPYNLAYRLSPAAAYNRGLVKRVEVYPHARSTAERPHIRVLSVEPAPRGVKATIEVLKVNPTGDMTKTKLTASKAGTRLYDKTGNSAYRDWVFEGANARTRTVRFTNGQTIAMDDYPTDEARTDLWRQMIRSAIETHFEKVDDLKLYGVKPLTLFFVDSVADVVDFEGRPGPVAQMFDEEYTAYLSAHKRDDAAPADKARIHYFAPKSKRNQKDSDGKDKNAAKAYDLIMRGKERLCSFEEPASFIFSHTALREGWDNPNVFVIATLADAASEMRKRQEIGRGIRLCVDQSGKRPDIGELNKLTVVTNETYERYVATLQDELAAEGHTDGLGDVQRRKPGRKPKKVKRTGTVHTEEFRELWERISRASRFSVHLDTEKLIADLASRLTDEAELGMLGTLTGIVRMRADLTMADEGTGPLVGAVVTEDETLASTEARVPLPDVITSIADDTGLTRATVVAAIRASGTADLMLNNPTAYAQKATSVMRRALSRHYVKNVQYIPCLDSSGDPSYVMEATDLPLELFPPPDRVRDADGARSAYDHVIVDADSTEAEFAEHVKGLQAVVRYVKLPRGFTIPTPAGDYNPDWAVLYVDKDELRLCFVVENKPTRSLEALRQSEQDKVACGRKHFEAVARGEVDFVVVSTVDEWAAIVRKTTAERLQAAS